MRWVMVVVLAGCFNPSAQPGAPCGENDACPGGLVCVVGTCERPGGVADDAPPGDASIDDPPVDAAPDAMEPDGPPSDLDGDGTANASDNCPSMANADQHDEDADTIGDVCDNCPHIANTNQANVMDNDTVGDVCDPNVTTDGDSIARFLPMHVAPSMVTTTGAWTQMGDAFVHTDNLDASLVIQGGPWPTTTIVIGGSQLANIVPSVWLAATVGEGGNNYAHCGYYDEVSAGEPDFHTAMWGEGSGTNWDFWDAVEHFVATRLVGAFTIRLTGNAAADTINCRVTDSRGTYNTNTKTIGHSPGSVGIRSEGISYRVDYVVVFTR